MAVSVKAERMWRDYVDLHECRCGECVRASECVSCVPGGVRGSFEDHGEGGPDVLRSRRGNEGEHVCPFENRESSLAFRRWGALQFTLFAKHVQQPTSSKALANETPSFNSVVLLWLIFQLAKWLNYAVVNLKDTDLYCIWQRKKSNSKKNRFLT